MGPLTSVTGTPATSEDDFVFLDAEKHTDGFSKAELEESVKRLAGGLREIIKLQDNNVVLAYTENSVSSDQLVRSQKCFSQLQIWYPVIILAAICAGGVFTGANPLYTSMGKRKRVFSDRWPQYCEILRHG